MTSQTTNFRPGKDGIFKIDMNVTGLSQTISEIAQFKTDELISMILGDIHLGSTRVACDQIIRCLMWALPDNAITAALNILYISGDLFDRLLSFNQIDAHLAIKWVRYLLTLCKKYDIVLRVVEGTPSHDWKQNVIFETLNNDDVVTGVKGIGADMRYISKVSIEYIERYDIHVLYVPDLKIAADDMWADIQAQMKLLSITQVDYAVIHGAFHHQLPPVMHSSPHLHSAESFIKITKHFVLTNHIHTPSQLDKILAGGSIERLRHGEEHPKGYIKTFVGPKRTYAEFKVNPHATQFTTIKLVGKNREDAVRLIEKALEYKDRAANIRIIANKGDEVYHLGDRLKKIFPFTTFTFEMADQKKKDVYNASMTDTALSVNKVVLTRDNLRTELLDSVAKELPQHATRCSALLEESM